MNSFAPILIFTLDRYKHFKRCVESLAKCTYAEKTVLHIALDYPANESHWDGYDKISKYLNEITGFKNIVIIKRDKNFGVEKNYRNAQQEIFKKHDRVIVSEDDNIFSPNFLDYINKGLDKFEKDSQVNVVCGYSYPITIPKLYRYNFYFSKGFSGWGVGIWKSKYNSLDDDIKGLNKFLHNPRKALRLNDLEYSLLSGFMYIVKSGRITGDRIYCYNNIINDTYSVFPIVSKVRNIGHDGSGVNCKIIKEDDYFVTQEIDHNYTFNYDPGVKKENKYIYNALRNHFDEIRNFTFIRKVKSIIIYLLFIIKH